ncbi:MAG: signal peptidase II [Gorillibacterium sp.]|nr:signal peptidase II [Gorillibacterium sp.]
MYYFLLAFIVFLLDQGSKWLIAHNLELYQEVPVLGHFFLITSHRNTGAAFSILEGQRWFFLSITSVVLIGIIYYMRILIRQRKKLLASALGCLLGGAIGNFYDRAVAGEVVDFLQFNFVFSIFGAHVDYTFPIFNIADTAISIGVALIILDTFISGRREKEGNNKNHESELKGT